jgi:formylglycine-generating enzyme
MLRPKDVVVALALLGALVGGVQACLLDFGNLTGGAAPGTADGGSSKDGSADGASEAAAQDGGCTGRGGPAGVRVTTARGSFCVDATEVTVAHYRAYLAAGGGASPDPTCSGADAGAPAPACDPLDPNKDAYPVTCVTWCQASAFCAWAGKRLCGRIGGGADPVDAENDPTQSEWMAACTGGTSNAYPYGPTFDGPACNVNAAATIPAGSRTSCQGGVPGLFDMSGNVEEWVGACQTDSCLARGGDFSATAANAGCTTATATMLEYRTAAENFRGFRCCAD